MNEVSPNRIEELGAGYFGALALRKTFDGSEEAYVLRENTYHGLPTELSVEEVASLAGHIEANLEGMQPPNRVYDAQARAIGWLAAASLRNKDTVTAASASHILETNPQLKSRSADTRLRLLTNFFRSA